MRSELTRAACERDCSALVGGLPISSLARSQLQEVVSQGVVHEFRSCIQA